MKRQESCASMAIAAVLSFAGASHAHAQETAGTPASASSVDNESSPGSNDIVVTAQRRAERLQDVPFAVSAFSDEALDNAQITNTKDLQNVTPGLNFTQAAFGPAPLIRGIGSRGAQIGDEAVVPQYVDGVYQSFLFGQINDFNNIERVEVLKGPQSALYGRNAVGGAINIITRTPQTDPSIEATLAYGRFNDRRIDIYATGGFGPIASDIAFHFRKDDGYLRNISQNARSAYTRNLGIRSKTVFSPSDRFDFTLVLGHSNTTDAVATGNFALNGNSVGRRQFPALFLPTRRYEIAQSGRPDVRIKQYSASLKSEYHGDDFEIVSISGFSKARLKGQNDTDATPAPVAYPEFIYKDESFIQEIYASLHAADSLQAIIGGVYFYDLARNTPSQSGATNALGQNVTTSIFSRVVTNSFAVYGQIEYEIVPKLRIIAAGRYTNEHKDFETRLESFNMTTLVTSTTAPPPAEKSWSKFNPSATLQFEPNSTLQFYARAANGFKSGIFNSAGVNTTPVNPQTAWQYELGAKASISRQLAINLAVYKSREKGVQIAARDPITGATFLQNAASTKNTGAEIEIQAQPIPGFTVQAGAAYSRAKFDEFPAASATIPQTAVNPVPATACILGSGPPLGGNRTVICDVSGNPVPRTPRFTFSLNPAYRFALGGGEVTLSGSYYRQSSYYWDVLKRVREPAYSMVNARAAWAPNSNLEFALWGRNLSNAHPFISFASSATADNVIVARPRTYGVEVQFKF